ncbi:AAA family ATPase [Clostridium sp. YIM B02505]|uniref:AAA family ATPase n=1 Tax=Clostridium yunnanense TaxID=2800325 RepID=A0ABS1EVC5_9CLOT|nr:AAA family ATPase [Clostridium yunnanense]MBK1813337.1 AAA family ATPase [Clostridium yunnanense]
MAKNNSNKEPLKPKSMLRILFPEIQVADYIKENGIINKEMFKKSQKAASKAVTNATSTVGKKAAKTVSNAVKSTEQVVNHVEKSVGSSKNVVKEMAKSTVDTVNSVSKNINNEANTISTNSNSAISSTESVSDIDTKIEKPIDQLEKAFDTIESELSKYVLGQKEYLRKLCIAFKRPFVYGDTDGVKNAIFVTGPKGSGRHLSIKAITRFLKEEKVLKKSGVFTLDLANYKLEKDADNLFLSDLYTALYGQEPVVVFDNYDKCHSNVLDLISKLVIDEKLELNRRFMDQSDSMVDVTGKGTLNLNTTDEIQANGKYLVFITEKSEDKIRTMFSSKFMQKVYDIISTTALTEENLSKIAKADLDECITKIYNNLSVGITFKESKILDYIINNINRAEGAHALSTFIEENIYAPIVELQLTEKIVKNKGYTLEVSNDELVIAHGSEKIQLASVIQKADTEGIEELNKELDDIIGLDSVKTFIKTLQDNIKVQNLRKSQGASEAKISLHMIFTGNPGTGKTTMARIMARYLKALGYLSSGHLVEVSRNDLVGQYVGETAQKTMAKVNSAMGGILFIDEAYSLARDNNDVFGIEAVDSLVKAVEDNRDNLVVILAGYTKEMEDFLKTNSGLKSRFNHNVEFPDYTPKELLQISKVLAKSNGYKLEDILDEQLITLYEGKQIKGKNDSGNGRLARNIIEQAIANQSKRLAAIDEKDISKDDMNTLTVSDFGFDKKVDFDLEAELSKVIGLNEVKNFIRDLEKQLIAKEKRKKLGINVESSQSLNMIFTGNPGTGKTTVARLIADLMKKMGILKSGQVIETDRSGLVGQYSGESTKKATEIFKSALGGVLFIDEAYAIMSSENDPLGKEAVDVLVKLVEDFREDIIVILAGYDKEMGEFLDTNSGLKSRFPLKINFSDYSLDELLLIGKSMIKGKGFVLAGNAEDELRTSIDEEKRKGGAQSGNGRMVRNIVEKAIRAQSSRIADLEDFDEKAVVLLTEEDFGVSTAQNESFDLEAKLKDVIGLDEVKDFVRSLQAQLRIKKQRKALGLPSDDSQTLHMIFKGNPGTGKTTMARIIGEVLYSLGVLKDKKFVETDRSGLVAGYVGQTAIKTKEKIDAALGGILFIDEAYALAQDAGSNSGFGKEAIDTLVKGMDDNRENLLVILAGYSEDMDNFLEVNPGLKSRFANIIEFKDYSVKDLLDIADIVFRNKGYVLTEAARNKMKTIFEDASKISAFGNGRYVRNLFEKAVRNQAVRLENIENLTKEHLVTIEEVDVSAVSL